MGYASEVRGGLREESHRPDLWSRQILAHSCRRVPARWHQRQSRVSQKLLVVVSEVCAGGFGAGRVEARSAKGEERLVGRFASNAAVGEAEKEQNIDGRTAGGIPCALTV